MSLIERYDRPLDRLLAELRTHYGQRLVAVAVSGSVGRGTQRQDSDVDCLIVARDLPRGRFARVDEFLPVEARLEAALRAVAPDGEPIMLSPVFKTPEELERGSPLFLDMVEDARILHDPEGVLATRLERLRRRLGELGSRRIWRGNALGPEAGPRAGRGLRAVTSESLARSYLRKARSRLKVLALLREENDYSDVVREAQELVELALKAALRAVGVEPPKHHDVGGLLEEHRARFQPEVAVRLGRAAAISKRLRKDRELAFHGDVDFIPTEGIPRMTPGGPTRTPPSSSPSPRTSSNGSPRPDLAPEPTAPPIGYAPYPTLLRPYEWAGRWGGLPER